MEKAVIQALLEKYWQAETTIAEEQALADYFRGDEIDPDLLLFRDIFAYFREEAQVSAGPDFGDRILQRLKAEDVATRAPFRLGVLAAAAAILALVAGLYLLTPAGRPTILASNDTAMHKRTTAPQAGISDTYDDPEQALAAVRHALLIASNHLNQGRRHLTATSK